MLQEGGALSPQCAHAQPDSAQSGACPGHGDGRGPGTGSRARGRRQGGTDGRQGEGGQGSGASPSPICRVKANATLGHSASSKNTPVSPGKERGKK